ncbi:MAG: hypothetical protein WC539_00825 [Nitrospirota bacterium]
MNSEIEIRKISFTLEEAKDRFRNSAAELDATLRNPLRNLSETAIPVITTILSFARSNSWIASLASMLLGIGKKMLGMMSSRGKKKSKKTKQEKNIKKKK